MEREEKKHQLELWFRNLYKFWEQKPRPTDKLNKTKYVTWKNEEYEKKQLAMGTERGKSQNLKEVDHFPYLGAEFYINPDHLVVSW